MNREITTESRDSQKAWRGSKYSCGLGADAFEPWLASIHNYTHFFLIIADQYWNGAFVNQPSQEASIVHARCHWHLSLPLPLRASSSHVREPCIHALCIHSIQSCKWWILNKGPISSYIFFSIFKVMLWLIALGDSCATWIATNALSSPVNLALVRLKQWSCLYSTWLPSRDIRENFIWQSIKYCNPTLC